MTLWLDAQLSPGLARWLRDALGVDAHALRDVGLRDALDPDIFIAARDASVVVMTKDADFVALLQRHGPPPRVIWIRSGNTSNAHLRELLSTLWPDVARWLGGDDALLEIRG